MCIPNGAQVHWKKTADFCRNRASSKRPIAGLATRYPSWLHLHRNLDASWACYSFPYVFSFSWPRHSTYVQNGIIDIIIIFEQGEKTYKQQRVEVMDTLRQNPLPIYASNHGWKSHLKGGLLAPYRLPAGDAYAAKYFVMPSSLFASA